MTPQMIDAVPNTVVLKQIKPLSALLLQIFLICVNIQACTPSCVVSATIEVTI